MMRLFIYKHVITTKQRERVFQPEILPDEHSSSLLTTTESMPEHKLALAMKETQLSKLASVIN